LAGGGEILPNVLVSFTWKTLRKSSHHLGRKTLQICKTSEEDVFTRYCCCCSFYWVQCSFVLVRLLPIIPGLSRWYSYAGYKYSYIYSYFRY